MKWINVIALMAIEAVLLCAGVSIASRNSSGTMSAINGPYTAGSVISSSVINARLADIETEITNSVDKGGRTVMTAPLPLANGTVSLPGLTFGSDTDNGLYRIGADNPGMSVAGTKRQEWTTTGSLINGTFGVSGATSLSALLTSTVAGSTSIKALSGAAGSATDISIGRAASEARIGVSAAANNYAAGSAAGDIVLGTLGTKLWIDTNTGSGTPSLAIAAANGGVIIGGGTAITSSFAGTLAWNPGTVNANSCANTTLALSGAATNGACVVSLQSQAANGSTFNCSVSSSGTVAVTTCAIGAQVVWGASNFSIRVFNP